MTSGTTTGGLTLRGMAAGFPGIQFARRKPLGAIGAVLLFLLVLMALFAPIVAPYDPNVTRADAAFSAPSRDWWLGTDNLGRDVLSRIVYGSRISLYVAILSVGLGSTIGAFLGLLSGYLGGKTDLIVQRLVDALMAFPTLILAIALVAALGASLNNVVIAMGLVLVPSSARVVRSETLKVRQEVYVEAAKAVGVDTPRILLKHILPNVLAPFLILAGAQISTAILVEASLSFLGLGVPPPTASWGGMLSGAARQYAESAPWMAVFPGFALSMTVYSVNMFVDAVRDVWDPRLRR